MWFVPNFNYRMQFKLIVTKMSKTRSVYVCTHMVHIIHIMFAIIVL